MILVRPGLEKSETVKKRLMGLRLDDDIGVGQEIVNIGRSDLPQIAAAFAEKRQHLG